MKKSFLAISLLSLASYQAGAVVNQDRPEVEKDLPAQKPAQVKPTQKLDQEFWMAEYGVVPHQNKSTVDSTKKLSPQEVEAQLRLNMVGVPGSCAI